MENDILMGATETVATYDGSGIFNPTGTAPETSKVVTSSSTSPDVSETLPASPKPEDTTSSPKTGILLYAGIALAAYYLFFLRKK